MFDRVKGDGARFALLFSDLESGPAEFADERIGPAQFLPEVMARAMVAWALGQVPVEFFQ